MPWQDYLELCKPKVVLLMMLTAWVGMLLASPSSTLIPITALTLGSLGIALTAGSAAVINHIVDRQVDCHMKRTQNRPLAQGRISPKQATYFALIIGILGLSILFLFVNPLTAGLTFFSLMGYSIIYTLYLKRATPQNIVIGGLAGALPPLLGWTAVTNQISPHSLLLVLIIFAWTPPHFWALAIHREQDYRNAKIPMLPVTHGIAFTKLCIVLYTLLMIITTVLPFVFGMSQWLYLTGALLLGSGFLYYTIRLYNTAESSEQEKQYALKTFWFSIFYLMVLFCVLLWDHYL